MNELFVLILLGIVQGITEWLPISSSGHLVLLGEVFNVHQGLPFDIALHFGTLMAVFVYFGKDILEMVRAVLSWNWKSKSGREALFILMGSVPAGIFGFLLYEYFSSLFSSLLVTGLGFGITSLLLFIGSTLPSSSAPLTLRRALIIGCMQVCSILPGISRSGTTLCGGIIQGMDMRTSARFSFLLSIPAVLGANLIVFQKETLPPLFFIMTLVSFLVGILTLHVLLTKILTSPRALRWFGGYALLAGIVTFLLALS
jgi:undecaprenyl-diphosphatase